MSRRSAWTGFLLLTGFLSGCAVPAPAVLMSNKSSVELRAMQSRIFPTADRNAALRAAIATLQDLGYSVDSVGASVGTVTATKLATLRLSASAYPRGTSEMIVRANAIVSIGIQGYQVDDPVFYQQDFFKPLAHTLALQAANGPTDDSAPAPDVKAITPQSVQIAAPASHADPSTSASSLKVVK